MTLRFYYSPRSCALASHIVLEHVGADYEAVKVDFTQKEQQSPEFLAINPRVRPGGRSRCTDGDARDTVLPGADFPDYGLAPLSDPFATAELQAVSSWFCSTVHVAQAHFREATVGPTTRPRSRQ